MACLAENDEHFLSHKEIEIWRRKKILVEGVFFAER